MNKEDEATIEVLERITEKELFIQIYSEGIVYKGLVEVEE